MDQSKENKIKRQIKKIKKTNKLYVRDCHGALRKLDNVSEDIYGQIIVEFAQNGLSQKYRMLNQFATEPHMVTAIRLPLKRENFQEQFSHLLKVTGKKESVVVLGNNTEIELVELFLS